MADAALLLATAAIVVFGTVATMAILSATSLLEQAGKVADDVAHMDPHMLSAKEHYSLPPRLLRYEGQHRATPESRLEMRGGDGDDEVDVASHSPHLLQPYLPPLANYPLPLQRKDVRGKISGPGYEGAIAGQAATFTLALPSLPEGVEVHYAYASLEGADTALASIIPYPSALMDFTYRPTLSGNYTLAIDLVTDKGHIPVMSGRWKKVVVKGEDRELLDKEGQAKPCGGEAGSSSVPWRGRWMKCSSERVVEPAECLRSGWVFRPDHCHYQTWTQNDLLTSIPQDQRRDDGATRRLVFLGGRVLRGVFLSAADLLLGRYGTIQGDAWCHESVRHSVTPFATRPSTLWQSLRLWACFSYQDRQRGGLPDLQ